MIQFFMELQKRQSGIERLLHPLLLLRLHWHTMTRISVEEGSQTKNQRYRKAMSARTLVQLTSQSSHHCVGERPSGHGNSIRAPTKRSIGGTIIVEARDDAPEVHALSTKRRRANEQLSLPVPSRTRDETIGEELQSPWHLRPETSDVTFHEHSERRQSPETGCHTAHSKHGRLSTFQTRQGTNNTCTNFVIPSCSFRVDAIKGNYFKKRKLAP